MIEVLPNIDFKTDCLKCKSTGVAIVGLVFQGIHVLADCVCNACKLEFYSTLPIAHDMDFPVKFDKTGELVSYDKRAEVWHAQPLIESLVRDSRLEADVEQKIIAEKQDVVILNCLDRCFGHVYLRLWNIQNIKKKYPDKGLIVLLPKNLEWLVPEGVDEVWTVTAPLHTLTKFIVGIDAFIKKQFHRFNSVFLSNSYPHLENKEIELEAFVKQKRFDLAEFKRRSPQITFVLREDRYWHRHALELFLFKACIKFNILSYFKWLFIFRQNQLVNRLSQLISKELDNVAFYATGLGKSGSLNARITDLRKDKITTETEMGWCRVYADSQVVIGIHGSHMLIPTSLAAGFIELLPTFKIPHLAQDVATQYTTRYSHFLCRYLDMHSSLKLVKTHAVSIFKDFPKW